MVMSENSDMHDEVSTRQRYSPPSLLEISGMTTDILFSKGVRNGHQVVNIMFSIANMLQLNSMINANWKFISINPSLGMYGLLKIQPVVHT